MISSIIRNSISRNFNLIKKISNYSIPGAAAAENNIYKISTSNRLFSTKKEIEVTFIKTSGERITAKGKEGDSLLDVVVNNNLDLDGYGACEGTLTCSTCHLILSKKDYESLPDRPGDEELDMLDLAYELTDTSRLGCQINLTPEMNGLEVQVPSTVNDARSQ